MKAPEFLQELLTPLLEDLNKKGIQVLHSEIHDTKLGLFAFVIIENTKENLLALDSPDILHTLTDLILWFDIEDNYALINWEYIQKCSTQN